mgnify:FL=1
MYEVGVFYFSFGGSFRYTHLIQRIMQREEAKYKKLKCYVLSKKLSKEYFADLLGR